MREFRAYAPAKLNIYLDVIEKRADGYHNIETVFEKIDLKDEVIIRERGRSIRVEVQPPVCPAGQDNIVHKALKALFREAGVSPGVEVLIKKHIPVSAGLGGGSSDAAAALRSANEGFGFGLSDQKLFSIAGSIGKDVGFFMLDEAFSAAKGAGEVLEPVDTDASFSHVIIKPSVAVPTAEMYARLDSLDRKPYNPGIKEALSAVTKGDISLLEKSYYNIFEEVLGDYAPFIEQARDLLKKTGHGPGFLSGSGPSVFCTVKERGEALEISRRIPRLEGIEVFLATTYKGGIYGDNRG